MQETPCAVTNQEVHQRVHKSLPIVSHCCTYKFDRRPPIVLKNRCNVIVLTAICSAEWQSFFVLPHENCAHFFPYACQLPRPSHRPYFYPPNKLTNSENCEPLLSNLHTPIFFLFPAGKAPVESTVSTPTLFCCRIASPVFRQFQHFTLAYRGCFFSYLNDKRRPNALVSVSRFSKGNCHCDLSNLKD